MRIIVDVMPLSCSKCIYNKTAGCMICDIKNPDATDSRLSNCPLSALENAEVLTDEVDRYGTWSKVSRLRLDGEIISTWEEEIFGRSSPWND